MNYISNSANMCCCGFNDREKFEVSEVSAMIDCETGIEVKLPSSFIPGRTYRCEERWALIEAYTTLATFKTKEQALVAYQKVIDGLRETNTVIDI